jgi:hypothetical protein
MRYGTIRTWDPATGIGSLMEDEICNGALGLPAHNIFTFHDTKEFSVGDLVSFEVNDQGYAVNVQKL